MNKILEPKQKIWGETTQFFLGPSSECQFMRIKKGYYCSEHFHTYKYNRFFVISGKLKVTVFDEHNRSIHHILEKEQYIDIYPGDYHKFEALEDTICVEIYWTNNLSPDDIFRRTVGGPNEVNNSASSIKL